MKRFHRLAPFSFLLLFVHSFSIAQQPNYTYADVSATGMAFSPDKQWLAVCVDNYDIDVFNLKTRKREARFHSGDDFFWNSKLGPQYVARYRAVCAFSPDNRYLLAHGATQNDTKAGQYLLDMQTREKYRLADADARVYMGFCDASTIWYLDRGTNTLGTARIATTKGNTEVSTTLLWSFTIPPAGGSFEIEFIVWDLQMKRFFIITRVSGEVARPIGTIKPGDTALTPMPKDVMKATKKFAATSATQNAVMFKNWKPEQYIIMDIHTFAFAPGKPFLRSSEYSVGDFDTNEQWWRSSTGPDNANSRFGCEGLKGNYTYKGFTIENGGYDYLISDDLSLMATSVVTGKGLQLLRVYNLKDPTAAPQDMIAPLNKDDEAFLQFVDANKGKFDQFVQQQLQKEYLGNGWELVSREKPFMPLDEGMFVPVEPGYQYLLYRIGLDYMYRQQGGEFPIEEHPLTLLLDGQWTDGYKYQEKTFTESYLGFTSEKFFHTGQSMTGWFSVRPEPQERLLRLLPPDGIRTYVLRKKTNWYDSGSHNFDEYRTVREKVVESSSSSVSSQSDCASGKSESEDLAFLRGIRDVFVQDPGIETVVTEVGTGLITKPFHAPDHEGIVRVVVFTSSPCNEIVLYNTTANTFEAARKKVSRSDDVAKTAEFKQNLQEAGMYYASINIDNAANTGTKYQVTVRRSSGGTTEGASLIWVNYDK